ncbi:MAG: acyltransferase [Anaerolineales bacterium]
MNALLFGLVFISPPFFKKLLLRWLVDAEIHPQAQIGWFAAVSARRIKLGRHSVVRPLTLISLSGDFTLEDYAEVSSFTLIYGASDFSLGRGSYVGPQSLINVEEPVSLGYGSALGPRSTVYTHGSFLPVTEGYWMKLAGVTIGDKVWCAAGVFLHPGTEIGDNSFVNSRSVVSGHIPPGSVVEGNPARVIYPMERVRRKMSARHVDLALERILNDFTQIGLRRELGISDVQTETGQWRFRWRGRDYVIVLVPSTGPTMPNAKLVNGATHIYVANFTDWQAPPGALVFDVPSYTTHFVSDPIHTALRLFALRYYGLRFTDQD